MENKNQINEVVSSVLKQIKEVVDVNTVIGDPFNIDDSVSLIPITKVSIGFAAGGGEYLANKKLKRNNKEPFAGGGGGGLSITPIGFLEVKNGGCKLIRINEKNVYQIVLDKLPSILNGVSEIINKGDKNAKKS